MLTVKEVQHQLDFIKGITAETLKQGHIFAIVITVDPCNLKKKQRACIAVIGSGKCS